MMCLRVMPRLERENDTGGRFTLWTSCDSQRHDRVSEDTATSCDSVARSAGAERAASSVMGATPRPEGLVVAWGRAGFHTPVPSPPGVAPFQGSLREGVRTDGQAIERSASVAQLGGRWQTGQQPGAAVRSPHTAGAHGLIRVGAERRPPDRIRASFEAVGGFEPDPRPAPADPSRDRMRDGHRREYDALEDREPPSVHECCNGAFTDVGLYGCISLRVLIEIRFRSDAVPDLAVEQGLDPRQQGGSGRFRRAELADDTAIDRASERERRRLVLEGKIANVGRPGAPRVALGNLPRKPPGTGPGLAKEPGQREVSIAQIVQSVIERGV